MPYLIFNNSRIYYESYGKGEPLLYIHGWNGSIDSFKFNLLNDLKNEYQIILLDLPGCGRSDNIELSYINLCELIDKLVEELQIGKFNLMGFCMGATIALDYVIRNQDKVKKLILVDTYIKFPLILKPLLVNTLNSYIFRFFLDTKLGMCLTKRYLFLKNYKYRDGFFQGFQKSDTKTSLEYVRLLNEYSKIDHYNRMKEVRTNVIIIVGDLTSSTIIKTAKKINRNIENSKLIFLNDSGHFPIEENGTDLTKLLKHILV